MEPTEKPCYCEKCDRADPNRKELRRKKNVGKPECILIMIGVSLLVLFWVLQHSFKIVGIRPDPKSE